jgi:Tfp pilus assembly protein PilF
MPFTVSQISTVIAVLVIMALLVFLVFARRVFFAGLRDDAEQGRQSTRQKTKPGAQSSTVLITRAHAHLDLGNLDAARQDFEAALVQLRPEDAEAEAIRAELRRLRQP